MEINFLGHASFRIKGKTATAVTDPYDPQMLGIKYPKVAADIVTISHEHHDHNYSLGVEGAEIIITGPGEYEVKGVKILGVATFHDAEKGQKRGKNTAYRIEMDRISIVHLGDLGHKLTDAQVDVLGNVDIVLIPVGGFYTINAEEATAVVSQLEPKIVIPMHYNRKDIDQSKFGQLGRVEEFLKEMGKENIVPQPKLSVTKEKLPAEPTIVVLE